MWKFIENGDDLFVAQPLNLVALPRTGQRLPGLQQGHSPGTLATDVIEQRKIVLARHLKLLGNEAPELPLRQQSGKEGACVAIVERFCLERQRAGQGHRTRPREPILGITETQPSIDEGQDTNPLGKEPDFQLTRHARCPWLDFPGRMMAGRRAEAPLPTRHSRAAHFPAAEWLSLLQGRR